MMVERFSYRSVPAGLDPASEHLAVHIGATITQDLVEGVPVPLAPGLAEIDLSHEDLFGIPAGRPGHGPPGVADDQALALERLAALDTNAIGAGNEHRVAVRRRHRKDIGHGLVAFGLPGDRHPIGRHADDVCALQGTHTIGFGKPAIVTDGDTDPADRRVKHRKAEVARLEIERLLLPQIHLAKRYDIALRANDDGAVVK